jgi:hypothetical protein
MMGAPPSNFTARAVVIRGGLFVSSFAAVFFEVYDAELERLTDGAVAALQLAQSSSVFAGISETAVTSCSCRDAASTDVAAIPLLPTAVRARPRLCSLHVDGIVAADVSISPAALVKGVDSSVPSLAVQVSALHAPSPVLLAIHSFSCRGWKTSTPALMSCEFFVMGPSSEKLPFGWSLRPSFVQKITRSSGSIFFIYPFCDAQAKNASQPIVLALPMPMPTQTHTTGCLLVCLRTCLDLASSGCTSSRCIATVRILCSCSAGLFSTFYAT